MQYPGMRNFEPLAQPVSASRKPASKKRSAAKQPTTVKRPATKVAARSTEATGPRRAGKGQARQVTQPVNQPPLRSRASLVRAASTQPRDAKGRFASVGAKVGKWVDGLMNPQKVLTKAPPKVKRATAYETVSTARSREVAPLSKRAKKQQKKKPVAERGFLGKIWALFNGDAVREQRATNAANTRARRKAWGIVPKKSKRRKS